MSTAKPNVLMIAYHFPPVGGAGVQRTVKFARYLPAFGFKPIVLAGSGPARDRWTPEDQGMLREIPGEVRVRRIPGTAPAPRGGWRGRMGRWIGRPSPFSRWWIEEGTRAGAEIIRNEDIELVYASMSPFESAEVAHRLASECDCPWVADLRDPWALDEMQVYPSFIHWLAEKRRMRRALASASLIVMNTPEAAVQLERAFPELRHKAVAVITNGYDAVEFPDGVAAPGNERFTIVHSGYLHTDMGLEERRRRALRGLMGGATRGADFLARSHFFLLQALEQWLRLDPAVADQLDVVFVGAATEGDRALAAGSSAAKRVTFTGFEPHDRSLRRVRSADLLFLPMHNLPPGRRATIVPGKTYEYMASGRPILAAVPDGDARDFLQQCGTAHLCRPDDVEGMLRILRGVHAAWKKKETPPKPDRAFLGGFERRAQTGALAREFSSLLAGAEASEAA